MHAQGRASQPTKNYLTQNIISVELENPWLSVIGMEKEKSRENDTIRQKNIKYQIVGSLSKRSSDYFTRNVKICSSHNSHEIHLILLNKQKIFENFCCFLFCFVFIFLAILLNFYFMLEFSPWVMKIPQRRKWQSTPLFLPGRSQWQSSSVGYMPWVLKRVRHNLVATRQQ